MVEKKIYAIRDFSLEDTLVILRRQYSCKDIPPTTRSKSLGVPDKPKTQFSSTLVESKKETVEKDEQRSSGPPWSANVENPYPSAFMSNIDPNQISKDYYFPVASLDVNLSDMRNARFGWIVHGQKGKEYDWPHGGVDLWVGDDRHVIAATKGTIEKIRVKLNSGKFIELNQKTKFSIKTENIHEHEIYIKGENGEGYSYHHLEMIDEGIIPGLPIEGGRTLGEIGKIGHLHFQVSSKGLPIVNRDPITNKIIKDTRSSPEHFLNAIRKARGSLEIQCQPQKTPLCRQIMHFK